jgi:hypothetical protein
MPGARLTLGGLCATVLAITGCGSSSPTSTRGTSDGGKQLVSYHRSGGIAYSNITLVLDADGAGMATSTGPTGKSTKDVQLSPDQLEKVEGALDRVPLGDLPKHRELGCADCYVYALAYGGNRYVTDEASLPGELKPVIAILDPIAADAMPAGVAPK